MSKPFRPSFNNFQRDIENQLKNEGNYAKNEYGQMVFRGYYAAKSVMYRTYLNEKAFAPLVAHFRTWNWEWEYDDYLLELSACLQQCRDWPLLKTLWIAVVAKRRTNYNMTKKARKAAPNQIPEEHENRTRELLLDSLFRLRDYAVEFQMESTIEKYLEMIAKVERKMKA